MNVIAGGIETLTEDWPGRIMYGRIGVAQAGPVDSLAFRAGNIIVGNPIGEVGLEIKPGFVAEFTEDALIAATGTDMTPTINGKQMIMWQSLAVTKGDIINFPSFPKGGWVSYLAIHGGIDLPVMWRSKSTCTKEGYGGFKGRKLQAGDELIFSMPKIGTIKALENRRWRKDLIPKYQNVWKVRAIPGPNSAPDYHTEEGMELWYSQPFKLENNAGRLGCRLRNPKPIFSRSSGGDAGHHPSMVPMQPYRAPGCLNVCGDFGVLLNVDSINAGGYVVALTVILADLWKLGQATPVRDAIQFVYCTADEAVEVLLEQDKLFREESLE